MAYFARGAQGRHRGDGQSRGDLKKPGTRSLAHLADFNAIAGLADSGVTTESLAPRLEVNWSGQGHSLIPFTDVAARA